MEKSPDAFRTISEVSDSLATPAHVLRFWESRFPQIRPVKRAGGRRYYRPADVALLGGIKKLLHDDGLTIRGVQRMLREQGIRYVAGLSPLGGTVDDADESENIFDDVGVGDPGAEDAGAADPMPEPELPFVPAAPTGAAPLPVRDDPEIAPTVAAPAEVLHEPVPEPETAAPTPAHVGPQDRAALVEQMRARDSGAAPERAAELARIYARLRDLRDRMAEANRRGAR
jgi:DNA-binding transcriptional MerR regulator